MPGINRGAPTNGRLNLEQQKKRAKELLKAFAAGDVEARDRFAAHSRRPDPQLTDAQHVIARELGFASWPRLKAHAEALAAARTSFTTRPDTERTLHIRCGSDIRQTLREAGFVGAFHVFADPFCQGPVRDLPREAFIAERRAFLEQAYGAQLSGQTRDDPYAIFERLTAFDEIVLWFEHDSYDQLILAFLLAEFHRRSDHPPVKLVCVDAVPATQRFIGLGELGPEVLRWLWDGQRDLTAEAFHFGDKVWRAVTAPDPRELFAIAAAGTPLVPPMAGALRRHLMELPTTANGLSLVEQITLELVGDTGGAELRALFVPYQAREPLPFLGDTMFVDNLVRLAQAQDPAIALTSATSVWRRSASLTETGRGVLSGERDWLDCGPARRWVGGVEIGPGKPDWRYDHARGSVILG